MVMVEMGSSDETKAETLLFSVDTPPPSHQ